MNTNFIRKFYEVELNIGSGGKKIATLPIGGEEHERVITEFLIGGVPSMVDADNPLPVTEASPTTILNGKTLVTTAGTRVVLAASTPVKSVTIKALSTNTGFIYVGNATVSSANGFQLSAGDTVSMDVANLNTINIDSSVSNEGVSYLAIL